MKLKLKPRNIVAMASRARSGAGPHKKGMKTARQIEKKRISREIAQMQM